MFIQTNNYNIELKASLRNISKLQDAVKAKEGDCNLRRYISKAIEAIDVSALGILVTNLGNLAYPEFEKFFDEYTEVKTVKDLFADVARTINDAGFFDKKLKGEDILEEMTSLEGKMNDIDMTKMMQEAVQTQVNLMMAKGIKTSKA